MEKPTANQFIITTDTSKMDLDAIHLFLVGCYWSKDIPRLTIEKAMNNSLCFGILDGSQQIGFARMITDRATYAYLADVYILQEYRGKGLSKQLMQYILDHSELQGLRRIVLATRDAHGLYRKFGFCELENPDTFMELWSPDVYQKSN